MVTPQKEPLRPMLAEEQTALEQLAKASSERVDRVRRATALLVVAQGASFAQAARQAGLRSGSTVTAVVRGVQRPGSPAPASPWWAGGGDDPLSPPHAAPA